MDIQQLRDELEKINNDIEKSSDDSLRSHVIRISSHEKLHGFTIDAMSQEITTLKGRVSTLEDAQLDTKKLAKMINEMHSAIIGNAEYRQKGLIDNIVDNRKNIKLIAIGLILVATGETVYKLIIPMLL